MKRTTRILLAVVALGAVAVAANKTVTFIESTSQVLQMRFTINRLPDGTTVDTVTAEVCGRARTGTAAGPFAQPTCHPIALPNGHAIRTAVLNLSAGDALTFWKSQESFPP